VWKSGSLRDNILFYFINILHFLRNFSEELKNYRVTVFYMPSGVYFWSIQKKKKDQ
jgi:hypothetical protein